MTSTNRFHPDVMLLAAGLGRRMLHLTAHQPKPLVEVAGRRLIDRVVENAVAEGLTHFAVNTHYLSSLMIGHVAEIEARHPEARFRISMEPAQLLGTGGGVKHGLKLLETDPVLVMNTDAFWPAGADRPITRMIEAFEAQGTEIVLLCAQPRRATGFRRSHDFCLAPDGLATNDRGAPVIYAGTALIRRSAFDNAPDTAFSLTLLFERALECETLRGVVLDAPWHHVGDPEALLEAERALA